MEKIEDGRWNYRGGREMGKLKVEERGKEMGQFREVFQVFSNKTENLFRQNLWEIQTKLH